MHLNGARTKPSKVLNAGDTVQVQRGHDTLSVRVLRISDRRGPATEAQTLYEESAESRQRREALAEQRRLHRATADSHERRPDKRQRRQIIRFRQKQNED